jgi:hypothetical protein
MTIPKSYIVALVACAAMGVVIGLAGGAPWWVVWATAMIVTTACSTTARIVERDTRKTVVAEVRHRLIVGGKDVTYFRGRAS